MESLVVGGGVFVPVLTGALEFFFRSVFGNPTIFGFHDMSYHLDCGIAF